MIINRRFRPWAIGGFTIGLLLGFFISPVRAEDYSAPFPGEYVPELQAIIESENVPDYLDLTPKNYTVYNVPFDADLQAKLEDVANEYGIDYALVLAIASVETGFDPGVIGDSGRSFGLMQIQPRWHKWRMDETGIVNLLDPVQNVTIGCHYLRDLYAMGYSDRQVLSAYNAGSPNSSAGARYAEKVLRARDSLMILE